MLSGSAGWGVVAGRGDISGKTHSAQKFKKAAENWQLAWYD